MNRRQFIALGAAAGFAAQRELSAGQQAPGPDDDEIDPYYLESPDLSPEEDAAFEEWVQAQKALSSGTRTRGGEKRPDKGPTYRFIHWDDSAGKFVWPFDLELPEHRAASETTQFELNAELLRFHPNAKDWKGKENPGTLSIDLAPQAPTSSEARTSRFIKTFEVYEGQESTLDLGWVCRDGDGVQRKDLIVDGSLGTKFQMSHNRESGKSSFWGKFAKVALSTVTNLAAPGALSLLPPVSLPEMTTATRNFVDGVVASIARPGEKPLWRGGNKPYRLHGKRGFKLKEGYWIAMDEGFDDLPDFKLTSKRGEPTIVDAGGNEVDLNYLVLDIYLTEL